MSLLTIAQGVCDEIGFPRPSSVAGSTDQLSRQLFALANKELISLSRRKDWPDLTILYTFTSDGSGLYPLPGNFGKLIANTFWPSERYWAARGSRTPSQWQRDRNVQLGTLGKPLYRFHGSLSDFELMPDDSGTEFSFEYVSKLLASGQDGPQALFDTDGDSPIVPYDLLANGLKWRIKHAKGLEYAEDFNQHELEIAKAYAAIIAADEIPVGGRRPYDDLPIGHIPENGFG